MAHILIVSVTVVVRQKGHIKQGTFKSNFLLLAVMKSWQNNFWESNHGDMAILYKFLLCLENFPFSLESIRKPDAIANTGVYFIMSEYNLQLFCTLQLSDAKTIACMIRIRERKCFIQYHIKQWDPLSVSDDQFSHTYTI